MIVARVAGPVAGSLGGHLPGLLFICSCLTQEDAPRVQRLRDVGSILPRRVVETAGNKTWALGFSRETELWDRK